MTILVNQCEVDTADLSIREAEVLVKAFNHMNDREIANDIGLSLYTIQTYKKRIRKKKKVRFLEDIFKQDTSKAF